MLAAKAKCELNTIVMRSDKSVNEYYHWLFKLWKNANTLINEHMKKFKLMLKPSIFHVLLAKKYNSLRELLAAARSVEKQKKKSVAIFHEIQNRHRNFSSYRLTKPVEAPLLHQAR